MKNGENKNQNQEKKYVNSWRKSLPPLAQKPGFRNLKRAILILLAFFVLALNLFINNPIVYARSGCCSHHGGVAYCDTSVGRQVCRDGTYSPSCGCTYIPPKPTPTKETLIKSGVEKSKADYYKNPHWFRERLISKLADSIQASISTIGYYVYTILPDVK